MIKKINEEDSIPNGLSYRSYNCLTDFTFILRVGRRSLWFRWNPLYRFPFFIYKVIPKELLNNYK